MLWTVRTAFLTSTRQVSINAGLCVVSPLVLGNWQPRGARSESSLVILISLTIAWVRFPPIAKVLCVVVVGPNTAVRISPALAPQHNVPPSITRFKGTMVRSITSVEPQFVLHFTYPRDPDFSAHLSLYRDSKSLYLLQRSIPASPAVLQSPQVANQLQDHCII